MIIQPEQWFWIVFALIAGFLLFGVLTKGWKGAMFGARIAKSYGTIAQEGSGLTKGRVRVHLLETTPHRKIGVEVVWTTFLSWQMIPIKLSADAAQRLIDDLSAAIEDA